MNENGLKQRETHNVHVAGLWARVVETARLMVGVGDYARYCQHMQLHHPDSSVMSEREYFRHCQNSRYPGKDGKIKRCPC